MFKGNKKGELAISYLGKIIIAVVALLILLYIIGVINGEFGNQEDKIKGIFGFLG